jgi:hypothetical protein
MANLKDLCVAIFLLALTFSCDAKKKCTNVVCPDYEIDFTRTIRDMNLEYFERKALPENGICLDGKEKYIAYGNSYGYPDKNICLCFPHSVSYNAKECASGDVQCPAAIPLYTGESIRNYYQRMGQAYIKEGISEGCCPAGHVQRNAEPSFTGVDKPLCFCSPPSDQIVIVEGVPK